MPDIDALLITPPSRLEVYQGLSNDYNQKFVDTLH